MKRIICLALCAIAAVLACACDHAEISSTPTQIQPDETAVQQSESETVAPTEAVSTISLKHFITTFDTTPAISKDTIYDDQALAVTLIGIDYEAISGPQLLLSVENKTGKDIVVQSPYSIVNGFMITPDMNMKIGAGKTAEGTLTLPYFNLAISNITTLRKVEFALRLVEAKNYNPITTTELITVTTSAPQNEESGCDESGQIAYDDNGIKIIFKGVNTDRAYSDGTEVMVYMINGTDKTVAVRAKDVVVNGYDMTSAMNSTILPDKRAVDVVTLYKLDMEEYGIDEIDSIKISFVIKDADQWETIDSTELISVKLPEKPTVPASVDEN